MSENLCVCVQVYATNDFGYGVRLSRKTNFFVLWNLSIIPAATRFLWFIVQQQLVYSSIVLSEREYGFLYFFIAQRIYIQQVIRRKHLQLNELYNNFTVCCLRRKKKTFLSQSLKSHHKD